jgi:hypothetical protein
MRENEYRIQNCDCISKSYYQFINSWYFEIIIIYDTKYKRCKRFKTSTRFKLYLKQELVQWAQENSNQFKTKALINWDLVVHNSNHSLNFPIKVMFKMEEIVFLNINSIERIGSALIKINCFVFIEENFIPK